MKDLLIASALLGCAVAFAVPMQAMAQADEPEEADNARAKASKKSDDRFCIEQTGSRVTAARNARSRSDEKECVAAGGRVYSREDIEKTGSVDIRDALRRLDPSIR